MASRAGLVAILILAGIGVASSAARTPPTGTAMFLVQNDPRMCPSPLCGGYWVSLANGVRTRCGNGQREVRCYAASLVDRNSRPLSGSVAEGVLARGALELGPKVLDRPLDRLRVFAAYAPAGTSPVSGGYYRVLDTGVRCVRAPCFSYRATQVNGSATVKTSDVDLQMSGATAREIAQAQSALRTKDGLYARGRFASTSDGGRVFRALRLYLRAPLPHA